MLKIGDTVTHLYDNPEAPLGEGRIVHMRKGHSLVLVRWSTTQCSEHAAGALALVQNRKS